MGQAARAVCAFCGGLRHAPPGVQQFRMLGGEQVWLHLQCRAGYEKEAADMSIPEAPNDGEMYVRQNRQWVKMPSGFSTKFEYTCSSATVVPPTNSQVRFNSIDPAAITKVWLNNNDFDGVDESNLLKLVESGFIIFIQDKNTPSVAMKFIASGPVTNFGVYSEIPVALAAGTTGTMVGDNRRVLIVVYGGG